MYPSDSRTPDIANLLWFNRFFITFQIGDNVKDKDVFTYRIKEREIKDGDKYIMNNNILIL